MGALDLSQRRQLSRRERVRSKLLLTALEIFREPHQQTLPRATVLRCKPPITTSASERLGLRPVKQVRLSTFSLPTMGTWNRLKPSASRWVIHKAASRLAA